jgi:hypothetical protein
MYLLESATVFRLHGGNYAVLNTPIMHRSSFIHVFFAKDSSWDLLVYANYVIMYGYNLTMYVCDSHMQQLDTA